MKTTNRPTTRAHPGRVATAAVALLSVALLSALAARPALAADGPAALLAAAPVRGVTRASWIQSALVFLAGTALGGYFWYFYVFRKLLERARPSWPLDAWRYSSYGAWLTTCAVAWAFKKPLVTTLTPHLRGSVNDTLIAYSMELILLPLLALLGLLVVWNFRRDAANRARPS